VFHISPPGVSMAAVCRQLLVLMTIAASRPIAWMLIY